MTLRSKLVSILALLLAAGAARADSINSGIHVNDDLSSLSGLAQSNFGAGNSVYSMFAPGLQWTNPENLALTSDLLALILALGGDPNLIALLYQPGAAFAGHGNSTSSNGRPFTESSPVIALQQSQPAESAPEPGTMELLGGTLFLLSWFAAARIRRVKEAVVHVPGPASHGTIQRSY
jgi:hypothetical protein